MRQANLGGLPTARKGGAGGGDVGQEAVEPPETEELLYETKEAVTSNAQEATDARCFVVVVHMRPVTPPQRSTAQRALSTLPFPQRLECGSIEAIQALPSLYAFSHKNPGSMPLVVLAITESPAGDPVPR